jgi:GTP-binding protein
VPGTTRDTLGSVTTWRGISFTLFDTGGLYGASQDPLHDLVVRQGRRAIEKANVLVFVVDGREGVVPADERIATDLRRTGRPVVVAINKMDDKRAQAGALEVYRLGFDHVVEISAEHGQGVGDLLDEVVDRLNGGTPIRLRPSDADTDEPLVHETAVAIVGRPNVGKSSLVNRLLNEERVLVSDLPGTTRDAIDTTVTWHRRRFRIVDTAGMRRPGRVERGGDVEMVSVLAAKRAIQQADVVALVLDATAGIVDQDAAIGGEADRAGCGIVLVANKWDLVKNRGAHFADEFDADLRQRMKFLEYAPVLHISARTGERAAKLLASIDKIAATRRKRITTSALNRFIEAVTSANPPVSPNRRRVRILYAAQVGVAPPSFVFFTNVASSFHFSYERYLVNQLREHFDFVGTPIRTAVRRRER